MIEKYSVIFSRCEKVFRLKSKGKPRYSGMIQGRLCSWEEVLDLRGTRDEDIVPLGNPSIRAMSFEGKSSGTASIFKMTLTVNSI